MAQKLSKEAQDYVESLSNQDRVIFGQMNTGHCIVPHGGGFKQFITETEALSFIEERKKFTEELKQKNK